jgi:hypothetical protein
VNIGMQAILRAVVVSGESVIRYRILGDDESSGRLLRANYRRCHGIHPCNPDVGCLNAYTFLLSTFTIHKFLHNVVIFILRLGWRDIRSSA